MKKTNQIAKWILFRLSVASLLIAVHIHEGYSLQSDSKNNRINSDTSKTILINSKSPVQILQGDTLSNSFIESDSLYLPGLKSKIVTSAVQDSAYLRALRIPAPSSSRFKYDLQLFSGNYLNNIQERKNSAEGRAYQALDLPSEFFIPLGTDIVAYQTNINNAMYIPGINNTAALGIKVPLNAIGVFFGVVEDVSPTMNYELDFNCEVEVVIYSVQATVIATIFKREQIPGKYSVTWNLRDDFGRKVSRGDYVGEIRIGKHKFVRKRIQVP